MSLPLVVHHRVVLLLIAAAWLAGCAQKSPKALDTDAVQAVFLDFKDAVAAGDAEAYERSVVGGPGTEDAWAEVASGPLGHGGDLGTLGSCHHSAWNPGTRCHSGAVPPL